MSRPKDAGCGVGVPGLGGHAASAGCQRDAGRQEKRPWAGIGLAALGALFMAFGIYRGEMPIVLQKAINICMECIGIG